MKIQHRVLNIGLSISRFCVVADKLRKNVQGGGVAVSMVLMTCCFDADANVRFDYSLDSSWQKCTVRGMHYDFWTDVSDGRTRLLWFPSVDCVLEADHPVSNWIWGVSTAMALDSFESDAGFSNVICGVRARSCLLHTEGFLADAKGAVRSKTLSLYGVPHVYSVASDNVEPGCADMPEFLRECESIVRTNESCKVLCYSESRSDLTLELRRMSAKFALYLGCGGEMSLMYSIGRDRDVSVFDFQYRDGQFYSPEGKKIDEPFVSGEVKSFDEGRQNSPLITTDEKSRSVSISFPARETLANIRINMENISSLSDCLKAVSQGEKCSWKAKAVNVYSGSGF